MMRYIILVCFSIGLVHTSNMVFSQAKFIPGKTKGLMPYIEYGPGDDRLGGAKMTYVDTGVLVKVIDSLATDYIIELAPSFNAFILKSSVILDTSYPVKPFYLSGNWRTYSDERFDYISIDMPEKLPYKGNMLVNPSRLAIDLFGITSNTNWITQTGKPSEIRNVWLEQMQNGLLRVYIDLKSKLHWGYSVYYDSTSTKLTIRVKHAPEKKLKNLFVAIDAGHGGDNSGAAGNVSGKLEKFLTLDYALALEKELKKSGVKQIFMIRRIDTSLSMPQRIKMLRDTMPDLLISIHFNSSSVDTVNGTSTFYRHIGFRPLTQTILKRMGELNLNVFGNVGSFNFALSGPTDFPNCLVEVAFLSNHNNETFILSKRGASDVAKKIKQGIKDWIELER